VFAVDGREILTSQIYFPGASDQIPDNIFRPDLLAQPWSQTPMNGYV